MFKKEDIKAGYMLEMKGRDLTERAIVNYNNVGNLAYQSEHFWGDIDTFEDDLTKNHSSVVKIYGRTKNLDLNKEGSITDRELLWDREKEYTEYTIEEIEKLLGKKIKIKGER